MMSLSRTKERRKKKKQTKTKIDKFYSRNNLANEKQQSRRNVVSIFENKGSNRCNLIHQLALQHDIICENDNILKRLKCNLN